MFGRGSTCSSWSVEKSPASAFVYASASIHSRGMYFGDVPRISARLSGSLRPSAASRRAYLTIQADHSVASSPLGAASYLRPRTQGQAGSQVGRSPLDSVRGYGVRRG